MVSIHRLSPFHHPAREHEHPPERHDEHERDHRLPVDACTERGEGRPPSIPWAGRLVATAAARALIARLQTSYGTLMFHQAGGDCDASPPLCFAQGDFPLVEIDVLLGSVDGAPFYVSQRRFLSFEHARVKLDAVPGRAGVFSLERPTGLRFTTRSRPLTPEEMRCPMPMPMPTSAPPPPAWRHDSR